MAPSVESLHLSRPDTGTGQDREPETQRQGPEIELGETRSSECSDDEHDSLVTCFYVCTLHRLSGVCCGLVRAPKTVQ